MHHYELVTILSPQLNEEELPSTVERISSFITGRGGEVTSTDQWGKRRLAYPIQKFTEGNYVVTQIALDAPRAAELEANLRISEDVLRYLLVRTDG